jgi:hypothetical protein
MTAIVEVTAKSSEPQPLNSLSRFWGEGGQRPGEGLVLYGGGQPSAAGGRSLP